MPSARDGFGRDVATVNVRGDGIVVIEEIADRRPPRTPSASWWFQLSPGDVWCMPGDKEHGYVRWNCYHGLPHDEIKEECQPGCTKCRISLIICATVTHAAHKNEWCALVALPRVVL